MGNRKGRGMWVDGGHKEREGVLRGRSRGREGKEGREESQEVNKLNKNVVQQEILNGSS